LHQRRFFRIARFWYGRLWTVRTGTAWRSPADPSKPTLDERMLKRWQTRILSFLAVLGPGFITANVDNDAGGILTYSGAGAQFGYSLLWTIVPITIALIVVQEMCARMGVVTGKGLSDLIREEFGLRATFITMVLLLIVNFGLVMTEFIGIAGSLELFHISKYISVPVCALLVWLLAVRGD
jgi:NRAMP (natural resistance-associated macrophage protein)-like metal ion transporter